MPTIVATAGARNANSYETLAEANVYFDERLPLPTPWVASGDSSIRALLMATRVLDAFAQPFKYIIPDSRPPRYRVRRTWNGTPASSTQKLAWPRLGLYDRNGNPLDVVVSSISVADPTVITTTTPHLRQTGDEVFITGSDSTPSVDGAYTITVIDETSFSIAVNVTVAGTTARVSWIPQELKDAESELAGQLLMADTTLDNSVITGGIKSVSAGSVSVSFKDMIERHVLPDAVWNLMPPSWFTAEQELPVMTSQFDVVSS